MWATPASGPPQPPNLTKYNQIAMAPPKPCFSPQREGRMLLAINSVVNHQYPSVRKAAQVYNVSHVTLGRRVAGITPKQGSRASNSLLLLVEEEALVQWILSMEKRGFPLYIVDIRRLAEAIVSRRRGESVPRPIGYHWPYHFLGRHKALQKRLTRSRDHQRAKQESPHVIKPWFDLIQATIAQYGILDDDIWNFDETGFAMGLITASGSQKVASSSENVGRITVIQPGNRKWTTAIETISARGQIIPPFIIVEGKVHLTYWYTQPLDPDIQVVLSANGWTNDKLAME